MTWVTNSRTKHGEQCTMVFGRKSPSGECARCDELRAGAPSRAGWQKPYCTSKARDEARVLAGIEAHFAPSGPHARGECGPVCTFGDR